MTDDNLIGGRYKVTGVIGTQGATPSSECDAESPSVYAAPGGTTICRCIVCSRCGRHTGNSNQGHFWAFCKATKTVRKFHMCCPDDCELEAVR